MAASNHPRPPPCTNPQGKVCGGGFCFFAKEKDRPARGKALIVGPLMLSVAIIPPWEVTENLERLSGGSVRTPR